MLYRVTEYKKGKLIVIEGNNILMPRIEFSFVKVKEVLCKMTITVSFRRLSYFFQVSIEICYLLFTFSVKIKVHFCLFYEVNIFHIKLMLNNKSN